MFSNSKIRIPILLISIILIGSSCTGSHFRSRAEKEANCIIEGTWATYKIEKKADDPECEKDECKTPVGLINVACKNGKVIGEHFIGTNSRTKKEIWANVSGEIEDDIITLSFINIDQNSYKPKNRIVYKINKIDRSRFYGKYYIRSYSDDKLIRKSKLNGIKRVSSWRQPKP